jgi:hypothetical protein
MKTKTVVLSALLGLAGAASVMADTVYSLNTVGYVNITFTANQFVMFANPLDTVNTYSNIFSALTDADAGCMMYKWDGVAKTYKTAAYAGPAGGGWIDLDTGGDANSYPLAPGQGAFFVAQNTFTNTFVGNVLQGTLTNTIFNGFSMVGSQVPQGANATVLGLNSALADGDFLYKYNYVTKYSTFAWSAGDTTWYNLDTGNPEIPVINVGEAVFIQSTVGGQWVRTFSVQ